MIFNQITDELNTAVITWEVKLGGLSENVITNSRNKQGRNIKQIVGHMVDSVSNNTHRLIHLQYQKSPMNFPNYATNGNNDKWIAIQNYQDEDWETLVQLWKFTHLHFTHVIRNINPEKIDKRWIADTNEYVSLKEMVKDFLRHFKLHISEIEELIKPIYK